MKGIAFVLLAVAVFGVKAAPQVSKDVAGDVTKAIKQILEKVPEPLLDVHEKKFNLDLVVEKLNFDLVDVELKGLKALNIKKMDYDEASGRLEYDLTFGDVSAIVDFDLDLSGLINFKHHPSIKVGLNDLKLAGFAVVDTASEPNQLTDFQLLVTLGGAKVDLTNILNDDELTQTLSKLLNENLPTMVDSIAASLEPAVSPIIQSAINIILRHVDSY